MKLVSIFTLLATASLRKCDATLRPTRVRHSRAINSTSSLVLLTSPIQFAPPPPTRQISTPSTQPSTPPNQRPSTTQQITQQNVAAAQIPLSTQWLVALNSRRTSFYKAYRLSSKDLKWSTSIAVSAKKYSDSLLSLSGCTITHGYQGNSYGGETLASSRVYLTPEQVLTLWYDGEKSKSFPQNLHFSQVVWRGTAYVGCGISNKILPDGSQCFIQACRYIAPGNCGVNANNLISKALQDSSPCGPFCPAEGCY